MLNKMIYLGLNHAPSLLKRPLSAIPFELHRKPLMELLTRVFEEPLKEGELDFLAERWLKIEVLDLNFSFDLSVVAEQLQVRAPQPRVDVTFKANSKDLLILATRQQDPDTLFFQRRLQISGDTELGLAIKNTMDALDWEQLPKTLQWFMALGSKMIQRAEIYQQETLNVSKQTLA